LTDSILRVSYLTLKLAQGAAKLSLIRGRSEHRSLAPSCLKASPAKFPKPDCPRLLFGAIHARVLGLSLAMKITQLKAHWPPVTAHSSHHLPPKDECRKELRMDRIPFCSATPLTCAQAMSACSRAAATILHDNLLNGSIAAATQRAFGESRGAEVRSL